MFWDKGPDSASALRDAGIHQIAVSQEAANSWKAVSDIKVEVADPSKLVKVDAPAVNYHRDVASATDAPWVTSNGWKLLRQPAGNFYYEAKGKSAGLAAAEAFTYGVHAWIHTDDEGLKSFADMLTFLQKVKPENLPIAANIGFVDDGTPESGEVLNLLVRRNLMVKLVSAPDSKLDLNVKLGTAEYPKSEAANPSLFAEKIRAQLTDEKRLVRVYGSYLVVARLTGTKGHERLYLMNYGAGRGEIHGIRIRVLGTYPNHEAVIHGVDETKLLDYSSSAGATEFTVPQLQDLAVIDLTK